MYPESMMMEIMAKYIKHISETGRTGPKKFLQQEANPKWPTDLLGYNRQLRWKAETVAALVTYKKSQEEEGRVASPSQLNVTSRVLADDNFVSIHQSE